MKQWFDDAEFGLVAISADSMAESAEWIAEDGIRVPLLSDPKLEVISAYGVAMDGEDIAVPATFVIRQDRSIYWRYIGESMADRPDAAELFELVRKAR